MPSHKFGEIISIQLNSVATVEVPEFDEEKELVGRKIISIDYRNRCKPAIVDGVEIFEPMATGKFDERYLHKDVGIVTNGFPGRILWFMLPFSAVF